MPVLPTLDASTPLPGLADACDAGELGGLGGPAGARGAGDPPGGVKTEAGLVGVADPLPPAAPSISGLPQSGFPPGIRFPLQLAAGCNNRENPFARHRRVKSEREVTMWTLALSHQPQPLLPCTVVLTRIAPGTLDDDNLVGAFKAVRDAVAQWLGVNDRRLDIVAWEYSQRHPALKVANPDAHAMVEITFEAYRAPRCLQAA